MTHAAFTHWVIFYHMQYFHIFCSYWYFTIFFLHLCQLISMQIFLWKGFHANVICNHAFFFLVCCNKTGIKHYYLHWECHVLSLEGINFYLLLTLLTYECIKQARLYTTVLKEALLWKRQILCHWKIVVCMSRWWYLLCFLPAGASHPTYFCCCDCI